MALAGTFGAWVQQSRGCLRAEWSCITGDLMSSHGCEDTKPVPVLMGTTSHDFRRVASLSSALMTPRPELATLLADTTSIEAPQPPLQCIAVQMRFGDACLPGTFSRDSRVCYTVGQYVHATVRLAKRYGIDRVVVASDSIQARHNFTEQAPKHLRISVTASPELLLFGDLYERLGVQLY